MNNGILLEDFVREFLIGTKRNKHDNLSFDCGGDVMDYSIKSSHFTLPHKTSGLAEFAELIEDYFKYTATHKTIYITKEKVIYLMNDEQFKIFLYRYAKVEKESNKNGGNYKIRCKIENSDIKWWLHYNATKLN